MEAQDLLRQMAELLDLQEKAIYDHPPETAAVYEKGKAAFATGQGTASDTEWSRSMGLSLDDLSLMHRYMLSSSFISAWYHLARQKDQRDKAANSCSLLVAGLGLDPEDVMHRYIQYEQLWRRTMKHEGIAPRRFSTVVVAIFAVVAFVILALLWAD